MESPINIQHIENLYISSYNSNKENNQEEIKESDNLASITITINKDGEYMFNYSYTDVTALGAVLYDSNNGHLLGKQLETIKSDDDKLFKDISQVLRQLHNLNAKEAESVEEESAVQPIHGLQRQDVLPGAEDE